MRRDLPLLAGEESGAALANLIGDAEILSMVGDGEPVERPVYLGAHAVVNDDFPATAKFEEVVGGQRDPEHTGVEGVAGVDVANAPIDAGGEMPVRVGRKIGMIHCSPLGGGRDLIGVLSQSVVNKATGRQPDADGRQAREGRVMESYVSFQGGCLFFTCVVESVCFSAFSGGTINTVLNGKIRSHPRFHAQQVR
jgi:hypothetical protein